MHIYDSYLSLHKALPAHTGKKGFVPTMGALHLGHLSLIDKAIKENKWVIVSIFVNPTQFTDPKDLDNYPRDLSKDLELLKVYGAQLFVYVPTVAELYGDKIIAKSYDFGSLDRVMEGAHRKNHFNGVATVVEKLFKNIQPDQAYFGEKDFQQLAIIKKLVGIKGFNIRIQSCPIVREKDGLAMSSRNKLLNEEERAAAPLIYQLLTFVQSSFNKKGPKHIAALVKESIENSSLFELEYFTIVDVKNLHPMVAFDPHQKYRAFIAVKTSKIRLIDNIKLG